MNNLFEYTKNRLMYNNELKKNPDLFHGELKEIMQEIILPILAEKDFFDNNAFQGGTAIRMLYGLKRYSDDLDFTMKENKIKEFSWKPFANHIIEYGKKIGIDFNCIENNDSFGNKILRIKSDSLLDMVHNKNIVPVAFTKKGNRKKIEIKLETNFSVNNFTDEVKDVDIFIKYKVRVFDLPSLFAGKLNAVLTREKFSSESHKKEKIDLGRDWYDLLWYINKGIKPNYNFLSDKLNYIGPFKDKNINADLEWVKNELLKRMEGLDYNILNRDIASITLKENRIILTKDLLTDKINLFDQS